MIKEKVCKGSGKAIGYKGCGKMVDAKKRRYGLCFNCYPAFLLTTDAGKIIVEKATLKSVSPRKKIEKELEEGFKQKKSRSSLSRELEKTQKLFNKYIRERDRGKNCISKDIPWLSSFDAGHLFSVKQYSALRFDYDNVHGQSIQANRFDDGDFDNYLLNLPKRIGKERTEALIKRAEESKKFIKKWTIEELKEIQEQVKIKLKEL